MQLQPEATQRCFSTSSARALDPASTQQMKRLATNLVLHLSAAHGPSCSCNLQDWTPLHSAVSAGHTEIVQALISGGADVNAANSSGQTALHYAVSFLPLNWCRQYKQS